MAKYLAQAVMAGANVMGRAFLQAFKRVAGEGGKAQAEKAAAGSAVESTSAFTSRRRMRLDEAKKILHVDPKDEALAAEKPEEAAKIFQKRYESLYMANAAPAGSFYLQSKIFRAQEALDEDFRKKYGIPIAPKEGATTNSSQNAPPKQ